MLKVGDPVGWAWGSSIATGVITEIHPERHEIISKGKRIVRNGTSDDPAIVIQHDKGALVLKLLHEVQALHKDA